MNLDLDPWLILPLLLVLFLMALPILSRRMKGNVNYTATGELNNFMAQENPVVVIDIRAEKDFLQGHIEGALNILPAALKEKIDSGGSDFDDLKQQRVVVICRFDLESIGAAKLLENSGFQNVSVLQGGILRWKRDHLPLMKG
mgnify:FL=1